jgi:polo-like kinase 1
MLVILVRKEDEYPAGRPIFWITRWVDVTSKFGISYQMSNASIGFLFNDKTKLVIGANGM